MRRFENDTFESVFFKSVEIESVVVSAHPIQEENNRVELTAKYTLTHLNYVQTSICHC